MSQYSPFSEEELLPQTERLEVKKRKGELFIGLPKESYLEEKRVCLTPDAVAALTAHGHKIVVETGAGEGASYTDNEYSEAGAKISYDVKEAFQCNIVLKVAPPTTKEIEYINPQAILISSLQLKTQTKSYFESLAKKRILLNTNADTIAAELAIGLSEIYESHLYYCFELNGVLLDISDENSVIERITTDDYEQLLDQNLISDGMLPKLKNCFDAINKGVSKVYIGNENLFNQTDKKYTTIQL